MYRGEVSASPTAPLRRDQSIAEIIEARPDAARVLFEDYGLPCYCCEVRYRESLAEGLAYSGHDPEQVLARLEQCPPRGDPP